MTPLSSGFVYADALILLCHMSVVGDLILASVDKLAVDMERRALPRLYDSRLLGQSFAIVPPLGDPSLMIESRTISCSFLKVIPLPIES